LNFIPVKKMVAHLYRK